MIFNIQYRSSINITLTSNHGTLHDSNEVFDDLSDIKESLQKLKLSLSTHNLSIRLISLTISNDSNKIFKPDLNIKKDFSDIIKLFIELRKEYIISSTRILNIETKFNDCDSSTKNLIGELVSVFDHPEYFPKKIILFLHHSYNTPDLSRILLEKMDRGICVHTKFYEETDDKYDVIECKYIKNITPEAPKFTESSTGVLMTPIKGMQLSYSSQRINYVDEDISKMYKLINDTDLSISLCPTIKRIKLSNENRQNSVHITSSSDNFVKQNVITNQVNNHNNSYTSELNATISEYQTQPLDLSCKRRQVLNNDICTMEYCSTEHLEGENHTIHPSSYCYNGSISKDSELDVSCIDRGVEIYEDYQ